jgi:hypothetical protein
MTGNMRHPIVIRWQQVGQPSSAIATPHFNDIQAPIERVLAELLNWHGSLGIKYERTEIASSLADALASLLPLAASQMR